MHPLLWIALGLVALWRVTDALTRMVVRRGAKRVLADHQALFSGTHEYVAASPGTFSWLDLDFYDEVQNVLHAGGFEVEGDVENISLTRQMPRLRTFIRVMSGDQGSIIAGFYHLVLRRWQAPLQWIGVIPRRLQTLDLETELSDGTWVVTSNTRDIDTTPLQGGVHMLRLPSRTPWPEVLRTHRERLGVVLTATGLEPRRCYGLGEILAAVDRLQRLRNETLQGREGLVAIIEGQPGHEAAKQRLIEEVRRG